MSTFMYAMEYQQAGFSLLPLRTDGSKSPAIASWKQYQTEKPPFKKLVTWFKRERYGIGLIAGSVSGGVEFVDFDMACLLWCVLSLIDPKLRDRLTIIETPGGWHLAYRCSEVCGSKKLAMWETSPSQERLGQRRVRIETRGEGGYVAAEGSPLSVHKSGLPYVHYMGPRLASIETITPEERRSIWLAAASFDVANTHETETRKRARSLTKKEHYKAIPVVSDGDTPWDWFDRYGDFDSILTPAGWTNAGNGKWIRPGKSQGISASVREVDGVDVLKVFSSSSELAGGNFGKFNLLVQVQFGGDRKAAARFVRNMMKGVRA